METPQGRILSVQRDAVPPSALVAVTTSVSCARCAAGKGCGAGILGGDEKPRQVDALIARGLDLHEGDRVQITLAPDNLLRASAIVYGLPLAGAVAGAAGAWWTGLGDLGAAIAALAGIGVGVLAGRRHLQRSGCLQMFTPTVTARLAEAGD